MPFLLYCAGLLLIAAVAFFVASPLFDLEALQEPESTPESEIDRWEKQKTDAYTALKEAEFDLQMGKLTDEDYQTLKEKYEMRALEALARLDRLQQPSGQKSTRVNVITASEASD
jgi:hypothetical protein